jgi:hypothetical protein
MNSACVLDRDESKDVIEKAIGARVPGILSYMSKNKWHVAKVVMAGMSGTRLHVEVVKTQAGHQPADIQVGQPVGVSFKYAYGKFLFDAAVEAFSPSADPSVGGGVVIVTCPDRIEAIQRRSYYRVTVPTSLKVNVTVWHRSGKPGPDLPAHQYCQGRLVDLSAGGAQIALDCPANDPAGQPGLRPEFRRGQYIGIRFTPLPLETPLTVSAQIRNVLPTADGSAVCLGLQLVGLEASVEGHQTLTRLARTVDQYYHMNQDGSPGSTQDAGEGFYQWRSTEAIGSFRE